MINNINLSLIGWMNGISATLVVVFAGVFGLLMVIQSKNNMSRLLLYGGLMGFFAGMLWLGPTADFISVILTGNNLPNEIIVGILTFMWVSPLFICAMYVGGEVIFKKENQHILKIISIILGVVFELILFLDMDAAFKDAKNPGGKDLYDVSIVIGHPIFYLLAIMLGFLFVFVVLGGFRLGIKIPGELGKRFTYLSFALFLFIPIAIIDAFFEPVIIVIVIRFLMLFVAWLMYLSLRIKVV